jgi:hypothetical protein
MNPMDTAAPAPMAAPKIAPLAMGGRIDFRPVIGLEAARAVGCDICGRTQTTGSA